MSIRRTNFTENSVSSATPVTIPFDCPSYYRGLLVSVNFGGATPATGTVTYNGVAMTQILSTSLNVASVYLRTFYLENPAQGVNDLVITPTGGSDVSAVRASAYANVAQTGLVNASVAGGDGGWNLTTTVNDAWAFTTCIDNFGGGAITNFTNSTNTVFIGTATTPRTADSNASLGVAGVKSINATPVGGAGYTAHSVALAPAVAIPILDTTVASNLALRSARVDSEVLYDGEATITARGFVYSTTPNPTLANSVISTSGTVGEYGVDITGLTVNTTYYVRSYATNADGTGYGTEISFSTLNIGQYELQKEIDANEGETFLGRITVTGTVGTVTVKLGTNGTATVINAGSGVSLFSGTYSGESGLIITRSSTFDGTIDDVYYVSAPLASTVDWSLDTLTIISAINSSVFFKRIENEVFNSFAFYRYLDLLFKDLDGFVTVTIRDEREDVTSERTKTFSVGNTEPGTVSPFQKKKISFLIKNQAVIIGLSNANVSETFSIAQFLLTGHKKPERMFSPGKIVST